MTTTELQKHLKTGDIIISRTGFKWYSPISYLSAAIRFFAKTKYNHAALVLFNWGKPFANEAIGRGVIAHPFGTRLKGKQIMVLRPIFIKSEKEIATKANSNIGLSKYDVIGLIWQAIYLTTGKWYGKRGKESIKRQYCFEYVAWVYNLPNYWRVTPKEFINSDKFYSLLHTTIN